jgi:hypothetical protein
MKQIFFLIFLISSLISVGQQTVSGNFISKSNSSQSITLDHITDSLRGLRTLNNKELTKAAKKEFRIKNPIDLPVFGLYGASNLNEETFKNLNASGKASLYFRPLVYRNKALTIYTSYNINASNNDSILYSTLIFPEVGQNSFLGTLDWTSYWTSEAKTKNGQNGHSFGAYIEFSHKNIKTDSSKGGSSLYFSTLNYTFGLKYSFNIFREKKDENSENTEANFFASLYLSALNIPDEDINDYRAILSKGKSFSPASLTDNFKTFGIKIGAQIKSFGVFADFRNVFGSNEKIPLRELKGFHSNIGFTLTPEIFHLSR